MSVVIFLDGESKSGKTAVGRAIKKRLEAENYSCQLIVAGNFFRRLTWLALQHKPAGVVDDSWVEQAMRNALSSPEMMKTDYDSATLEEHEVDKLVSSASQYDFVQLAANPWRERAAEAARLAGTDVIILDGRNLRARLYDWRAQHNVPLALELVIYCNAPEAARRYLSDHGNKNPTENQLNERTRIIKRRRNADRTRREAPYIAPVDPVCLVAGVGNVKIALKESFNEGLVAQRLPRPILFDNSEVPRDIGLATVSELAFIATQKCYSSDQASVGYRSAKAINKV